MTNENMTTKKSAIPPRKILSLREFVELMGSKERAAAEAGVTLSTYCRWLNGENTPRGNNRRRLLELGVRP
jgi:DNA-binding transcriptional regulator YiaG